MNKLGFLEGGGEMGELTRSYAWDKSSLGTPDSWPKSLQTTVGIILHSAFPMFLFWGKDLICFYNDAYRPSLGNNGKHPLLAKKGKDSWPEIWSFIGPLIEKVQVTGEAVWFEDQFLPIYRNGKMENVYWTFSYSPVYDEDSTVQGVFVTCTETTAKVVALKELQATNSEIEKNQQQLTMDFTKQELAGKNLEEVSARLKTMIEQTPAPTLVLMGDDLVVEQINDPMLQMIGRGTEVIGKPLISSMPELEGQYVWEQVKKVYREGVTFDQSEVHVTHTRGNNLKDYYYNIAYRPLKENGEIIGMIQVAIDVTELVVSRQKIEESEAHLQLTRNAIPAMVFYLDTEQRYRSYNGAFMEWFKVNATDALGLTTREFIGETAYAKAQPQLAKAYAGERVEYHMHAPLRIGGEKWLNIVYTPHKNTDGKVLGVIVHATDITEHMRVRQQIEQNEKELRELIYASPIGICVLNGIEARIEGVNEKFIQISGKNREQFVNATYWEVFPEVAEAFAPVLKNVFETGIKFTTQEAELVLIRHGVPETMFATFEYIPVYGIDNTIVKKVIVMVVEVTHQVETRKRIENAVVARTKELGESNLQLKRSNEELEQFAYVASHDLQEPIRKISTFMQLLEMSLHDLSAKSKDYISRIYNSTDRMSKLVRDVLAYSRVESDSQDFERVDLNVILEGVKSDFELTIADTKAEIEIGALPLIWGIPSQMTQLFGNLMSNALKYRKAGTTPMIKIAASRAPRELIQQRLSIDPSKEYHLIEFSDNGIGFDKEYVDRIFRIFQRLHGKTEYEGTGIGLAICLKIIHHHGGHISASVGENGGAVFSILLPV